MNKFFLIPVIFFVVGIASPLFAQKLTFSYDAAGNQIERRWVCINCLTDKDKVAAKKIAAQDNLKSKQDEVNAGRTIKVYPNPVSETLNVSWQTPEKISLKRIEVFSMAGTRVYHTTYPPGQLEDQIAFSRLPPGTYVLIGYYSDSKTQSLKIIKI